MGPSSGKWSLTPFLFLACLAVGMPGCVNKENYTKEVNRANNFQRLLAEEEKRSVELSAEITRLKDQFAVLDAKNKTLTAQINEAKAQVVRSLEEVGRLQDEVKQARAMTGPAATEPPDRLDELRPPAPAKKKGPPAPTPKAQAAAPGKAEGGDFKYHMVKKGETLKSIAKLYNTDADTLRELNDMANGDAVSPGDRIIVGQQPSR